MLTGLQGPSMWLNSGIICFPLIFFIKSPSGTKEKKNPQALKITCSILGGILIVQDGQKIPIVICSTKRGHCEKQLQIEITPCYCIICPLHFHFHLGVHIQTHCQCYVYMEALSVQRGSFSLGDNYLTCPSGPITLNFI